jgi:hypothetical protein
MAHTQCVHCAVGIELCIYILYNSGKSKNLSVVEKVVLEEVFRRVFRVYPVSIIPPEVNTLLHLRVTVTRKTNGRSLEPSKKQCCLGNLGRIG